MIDENVCKVGAREGGREARSSTLSSYSETPVEGEREKPRIRQKERAMHALRLCVYTWSSPHRDFIHDSSRSTMQHQQMKGNKSTVAAACKHRGSTKDGWMHKTAYAHKQGGRKRTGDAFPSEARRDTHTHTHTKQRGGGSGRGKGRC
mmetsp:Transcript_17503/g.35534  ORF Transcript_17503/g.35534 Transcript_17503/m.35534 type:complete len:148 (+) Transcript_17503:255-698(+)